MSRSSLASSEDRWSWQSVGYGVDMAAAATCLFRDGRHVCGEPAVGTVGIGVRRWRRRTGNPNQPMSRSSLASSEDRWSWQSVGYGVDMAAAATCLFRDGRHVCGEPAVGTVGIGVASAHEVLSVGVCVRHLATVEEVYASARPEDEPPAVEVPTEVPTEVVPPAAAPEATPGAVAPTPEAPPSIMQIQAGDTIGESART